MRNLFALLLGTYFGMIMVKSEVASWFRVQKMFRFGEPHMYLIIMAAIAVALIAVQVIKRGHWKAIGGKPPEFKSKPFTKGTVIGGFMFGMGWAITGACPGPIYAQIGKGEPLALCSFAGAFVGAYLYAWLKPRLPH